MAKKIDLLHQLVHSLTPAEKRYFKLSITAGSKQPNYVKLFNLLEEAADTGAVFRNKVKRSGFNITYESEQLQKTLTRSLRDYHEEATSGIQLLHVIAGIEVLYIKQQYDYCASLIEEYLEEAKTREKYALVLELLAWKRRLLIRRPNSDTIKDEYAAIYNEEKEYTRKIENLSAYIEIQVRLTSLTLHKGTITTGQEQDTYHEIMKHPLLANPNLALGFSASTIYHNAWIRYYSNTIQLEKALQVATDFLKLYESNKAAILYQTQAYFIALVNVMNRAIQLGRYNQAIEILDKVAALRNMKGASHNEQLETDIIAASVIQPMIIYNINKQFEKTVAAYQKWKPTVESGQYVFDVDLFWKFYHFLVAKAFLYVGNYDEAMQHIHVLLHKYNNKKKLDVMLCVYLLNILVHYEIGNYQSIPHLLKSARRFAAANNFKQSMLPHFFKMITQLINAPDKNEKEQIYNNYYATYTTENLSPDDETIISSLDLDYWITTKAGR